MIIEPDEWMKLGMIAGAVGLPVYIHNTNKSGAKVTFGQTCAFIFAGAVFGFLASVILLCICGFFGIRME